jgi:poly-D-alanine transfer protein DltD
VSQAFHLTDLTGRFYDGHKTAHGGWNGWHACLVDDAIAAHLDNSIDKTLSSAKTRSKEFGLNTDHRSHGMM